MRWAGCQPEAPQLEHSGARCGRDWWGHRLLTGLAGSLGVAPSWPVLGSVGRGKLDCNGRYTAGSKPRADGNREAKGTAVAATAVSPRRGSGLRLATAAAWGSPAIDRPKPTESFNRWKLAASHTATLTRRA